LLLFLAIYVLLQLGWWGYLIVREEASENRVYMVLGEGLVFASILIFAFVRLHNGLRREVSLAKKERNFMLSVSHELKTPIAAIKLSLDALGRSDLPDAKRSSLLEHSNNEIRRLQKLTENILLASQLDQSISADKKQTVEISSLLEEECLRFQLLSGRQILRDIQSGVKIDADADMLRAMFSNLLDNAIKYSPLGGEVEVALKFEHHTFEVRVSDQGIGISDQEKSLIFQRFYRSADEITRSASGTGLGLYIVKSICQLYQFKLSVENNSPKGSVFIIQFIA
ncbi:MAG: sensor histidine kinase, partial [Flavobacteriales bacterium]